MFLVMFYVLTTVMKENRKKPLKRKILERHVIIYQDMVALGFLLVLSTTTTKKKKKKKKIKRERERERKEKKKIWSSRKHLGNILISATNICSISSTLLKDLLEDNKVQDKRDVKPSVRGIL